MNERHRPPGFVLFAAVAALLLPGCDRTDDRQSAELPEPIDVRMALSESHMSTPVLIALRNGYFDEQGIRIQELTKSSGKACLDALLAGEAGIATVADSPLMAAGLEGETFSVIAGFILSYSHGRILARTDRGVSEVTDLAGKRVGVSMGTTGEYFLYAQLGEYGLEESAVEKVNIPTGELVEALKTGRVDAISTWEPHVYHGLEEIGPNAVRLEESRSYRSNFNLVVKREREYEDIVLERVLKGLIRAEEFIRDHPEEARALIAERLDMSTAYLDSVWTQYEYGVFLDDGLVLTLEAQARWKLNAMGRAQQDVPDFGRFIDPDPLRAIAPERVTLQ